MKKKILVAGIGNKLMGDDGFGSRVVELLLEMELPENVEVADYGTAGFMLASDLEEYDFVLFADAFKRGGKPGELYILELKASDINDVEEFSFSMHEAGVEEMLAFAKKLGALPEKIVIIGCEPKILELRLELSSEVEIAAKKAVDIILEHLRKLEKKIK